MYLHTWKKALQSISTLFQTSQLKKMFKVQIPKIIPKIILNYQQQNELHSFPTYGEEILDVNMLWILRKKYSKTTKIFGPY